MLVRSALILSLFSAVGGWLASVGPARAITIDVRPYCEVAGGCKAGDFFFDYPQALPALEFAAKAFEPFADSLLPLSASPGWDAIFTNPDSGTATIVKNLAVPANTWILYAGGYDMPGTQVGQGGPGLANISLSRGQGTVAGAEATDFASWGGSIAFDTHDSHGTARNWHFGIDTRPAPGQVDFLTIAFHELAHVFGLGTADSFDNLVGGQLFNGESATALLGAAVPLTYDHDHWAGGTTSPPYAQPPASALTATLLLGRRTLLTPLDYAALKDLGWEVPDKLLGLHGDGDQDGDVDGRDFLLWQRGFGQSGSMGDFNGDLSVDEFDLWLWRHNMGAQLAEGFTSATMEVPEPNTAVLIGLLSLAAAICRLRPRN